MDQSSSNLTEPKKILVIDDDRQTCDFFKALLNPQGFEVLIAYSGKSAMDVLKSSTYPIDLIVLDLMMPGYSGYEVLKELQQGSRSNVPIFVITARNLDPVTVEMIQNESNVSGFWSKPVDTKEFVRRVHLVLGTAPREKGGEVSG